MSISAQSPQEARKCTDLHPGLAPSDARTRMALLGQDTHDLRIMQTYPESFRAWFAAHAPTASVNIEIVHDHTLAGSGIADGTVVRLSQRLIARPTDRLTTRLTGNLTVATAAGASISVHTSTG
jgi:hypothetical protein